MDIETKQICVTVCYEKYITYTISIIYPSRATIIMSKVWRHSNGIVCWLLFSYYVLYKNSLYKIILVILLGVLFQPI